MLTEFRFQTVPLAEILDKGLLPDNGQLRPVVLVVDDEQIIADTRAAIFDNWGYLVMTAYSAEAALELAEVVPPELLISDVILTGMNGVDLAIAVEEIAPDCKILLLSGVPSGFNLLTSAIDAGHRFTMLDKPLHPAELQTQLEKMNFLPLPKAALEAAHGV